jgi:hypothetical protein
MCYAYSLKKRALKKEMEYHKKAVSLRKQVNALIMEAKKALIADKPKYPDSSHKTSASVRERLSG